MDFKKALQAKLNGKTSAASKKAEKKVEKKKYKVKKGLKLNFDYLLYTQSTTSILYAVRNNGKIYRPSHSRLLGALSFDGLKELKEKLNLIIISSWDDIKLTDTYFDKSEKAEKKNSAPEAKIKVGMKHEAPEIHMETTEMIISDDAVIYTDSGQKKTFVDKICVFGDVRVRVVLDSAGKQYDLISGTNIEEYNGHKVLNLGNKISNNEGELYALYLGLKKAISYGVKIIRMDSKVVGESWVEGNGKSLKEKLKNESFTEFYAKFQTEYKRFIALGGKIEIIPGDDNIADLGDHK